MAAVLVIVLAIAAIVAAVALAAAPFDPPSGPWNPTWDSADRDARAVRDFEATEEQFRDLIDELYDLGERIAGRRQDRS